MSNSDDTDVLLLIPPDFFLVETSSIDDSDSDLISFSSRTSNRILTPCESDNQHCDNYKGFEIINRRLQNLESSINSDIEVTSPTRSEIITVKTTDNNNHSFEYSCDISGINEEVFTISMNTSFDCKRSDNLSPLEKEVKEQTTVRPQFQEESLLKEIDIFLNDTTNRTLIPGKYNQKVYEEYSLIDISSMSLKDFQPITQNDIHLLANGAMQRHNELMGRHQSNLLQPNRTPNKLITSTPRVGHCSRSLDFNNGNWKPSGHVNEPLISLNDIWGDEGATNDTTSLQEERLRREHCEKSIQVLQTKLLEYQQKISVAIKVDKTKDDALSKMHESIDSFKNSINYLEMKNKTLENKLREGNEKLDLENRELKQKIQILETELAQSIDMSKKFQERNEILESKVEHLTSATTDIREIHKKQIEDLQIRLSNSLRAEELLNDDLIKVKGQLSRVQQDYQGSKGQLKELQGELEITKQQKQNWNEKFKEEKSRADIADKQKKSYQQALDVTVDKEKSLLKELETQRVSLKSYYQNQLEQVVSQKLKEFQQQLDTAEETLKAEASHRERTIAERALRQMELIIQKNDQEITLLNQKHSEEITLYRLQLVNASKTIDDLQHKLNAYQTRRADIAERLHNVMETQWQKALEIITSPTTTSESTTVNNEDKKKQKILNAKKLDKERADGVASLLYDGKYENENYETPSNVEKPYSEKLHAYIDMLLKKSPRELDFLDDFNKNSSDKIHKSEMQSVTNKNESSTSCKRPWR